MFRQNVNIAQFIIAVCQEIGPHYQSAVEMKNPAVLLAENMIVPAAVEEKYS